MGSIMKEWALASLLIATNISTAGIFAAMWRADNIKVCEPNIYIRTTELVLALLIAGYGIWYIVDMLQKKDE